MKMIPLTQGQCALVDHEDFEWLSNYKWCAYHPKREAAIIAYNEAVIKYHGEFTYLNK
jgi:hypothetical protein